MSVQAAGKTKKRGCGWWALVALAIIFACSVPFFVADRMGLIPRLTPTPTATPAPTVAQALQLPTATPEQKQLPGIGSPIAVWQETYGEPREQNGFKVFGDWETLVFPGDFVEHIERTYDPPVKIDQVRTDITGLLPLDATFIETYTPEGRPEAITDLYSSASLAISLPADAWVNGQPGQFIVLYKQFADGVSRVIIGTGNNP